MVEPQPTGHRRSRKRMIAIAATVAVTILAVTSAAFLLNQRSGRIVVTVRAVQMQGDSNYRVFMDGQLKHTGTLAPGQDVEYTFDLSWFFDACQRHEVAADSSGPHMPGMSDSRSVNLCNGAAEEVFLQV